MVKPVKSLAGSDKINARVGQGCRFSRTLDAGEVGIVVQQPFGGCAHLPVWLHAKETVPVAQKEFAKQAGSRTNIGDHGAGGEPALISERVKNGGRIRGPVADVIFHPARKALGGIH